MKKLNILALASLLMAACTEDVEMNKISGEYITFNVTDQNYLPEPEVNTRTAQPSPFEAEARESFVPQNSLFNEAYTPAAANTNGKQTEIVLPTESDLDDQLVITASVEQGIRLPQQESASTRGTKVTAITQMTSFGVSEYLKDATTSPKFDNATASVDGTTNTLFHSGKTWEGDATTQAYDFYAYYPNSNPEGANANGITINSGGRTITYDMSSTAISDITKQPDLITGAAKNVNYSGSNTPVALTMSHRLCAVAIKLGSASTGYKLTSVSFSDIRYKGTVNVDGSEYAASSGTPWSTKAASGESGEYSLTGLNITQNATNDEDVAVYLMMIPQTLNCDMTITIQDTQTTPQTHTLTTSLTQTLTAGTTTTYTISPAAVTFTVKYPCEANGTGWADGTTNGTDGPVNSYASGESFGLFAVDKNNKIVISNEEVTASAAGNNVSLTTTSGKFYSSQYQYFLYYPYKNNSDFETLVTTAKYNSYYKEGVTLEASRLTSADTFLANVITKWGVKTNQSEMSDFKASDLQTAKYNSGFAMSHRMGLAIIDMTTGKSVPSTATWTYDKNDGTYTESGTESSDAHTTIYPYHGFNVTTSSGYSIPLNAATASTDCYYIVKSTSTTASTSVKFGCGTEETKEYWTDVTISDIGYGKCYSETITSDREFASLIALFSYQRTCQKIKMPWYGSYQMECWGANGGSVSFYTGSGTVAGGAGGYVKGQITLEKDLTLYVYVGEQGGDNVRNSSMTFNGGGGSYWYTNDPNFKEGRGGGATDIRIVQANATDNTIWNNTSSLRSRIMVAAGGGGATNYKTTGSDKRGNGTGGAAGGLKGYSSSTTYVSTSSVSTVVEATGGSQDSRGLGWKINNTYSSSGHGAFGYGGTGTNGYPGFNAGGGAGWYGGGSGGVTGGIVSSAAGGSSFISGHSGCNGWNNESVAHAGVGSPSRILVGSSYRNFTFSNYEMIDGKGLKWAGNQNSGSGSGTIPTKPDGDGYAKIISQ